MNPVRTASLVVVSASMALVATHAMASVAKDSSDVINIAKVDLSPDIQAKIDAAVAKKDVKQAVAGAFSILSTKFGYGNESLTKKYFTGNDILLAAARPGADDFTGDTGIDVPSVTCYSNCHSACHSACHGSRGWR
ncbi:hypothetical protein G6L37_02305 [Agrobacterium rubi]|nr:hypothetical protein [Agrobacterium rubi]NTF24227.1 hypothetical protein [Agrobacterium rubi]